MIENCIKRELCSNCGQESITITVYECDECGEQLDSVEEFKEHWNEEHKGSGE